MFRIFPLCFFKLLCKRAGTARQGSAQLLASIQEAKARGPRVPGQSGLHSKTLSQKNQKKQTGKALWAMPAGVCMCVCFTLSIYQKRPHEWEVYWGLITLTIKSSWKSSIDTGFTYYFIFNIVSCSPDWLQICYADRQGWSWTSGSPVFSFQMLGPQVCAGTAMFMLCSK